MKVKIDPDKFPSKYLRDYPEFLSQLHPELNQNKSLNILCISSGRAVLAWICPEGHTYRMSLRSKILRNRNCQECAKILREEKKKKKKNKKKQNANHLDYPYERLLKKDIRKIKNAYGYRDELEPFVGACVCIQSNSFEIDSSNSEYDRIILRDVKMIEASKRTTALVNGVLPSFEHIWTRVDKGFAERNKLNEKESIILRGIIYRYINSRNFKNIGFRTICIKNEETNEN